MTPFELDTPMYSNRHFCVGEGKPDQTFASPQGTQWLRQGLKPGLQIKINDGRENNERVLRSGEKVATSETICVKSPL